MIAVASDPFVPASTATLRAAFPEVAWESLPLDAGLTTSARLAPGAPFVPPGLLFQKLDADVLAGWEQQFGGTP